MKELHSRFRIGEHRFVFPAKDTLRALGPQQITPIPLASSLIAGMINLRGEVLLVVNLPFALGIDTCPPEEQQILVTFSSEGLLGFLVDRIEAVVSFDATILQPPPENIPELIRENVSGCIMENDDFVFRIYLEEFMRPNFFSRN